MIFSDTERGKTWLLLIHIEIMFPENVLNFQNCLMIERKKVKRRQDKNRVL